jgi:putative transposase
MTWENFELNQQRLQLVQDYIEGNSSMTELCLKFGISRKTGYKWYERFLEQGEVGLVNLSKARHNNPLIYNQQLIDKAIDYKLKHRRWGPKKILIKLNELYPEDLWPSPTRLYEIFKEYHLTSCKRIKSRVPATGPLGDLSTCNDTWTIDMKGWFLTGDGFKCEPLTIVDSFSRYLIKCTHLNKHTVDYVWPVFDEAFREYGLPNRIRSDNGSPFGSTGVGRLTKLSVKFIKAGVIPEWINPGHPEENGRHERFHLTLKQDTASPPKNTLALQIQTMKEFQDEYNFDRPHEALNMRTPANCYQPSPRNWDGKFRSPEYDTKEMQVRKVCPSGCIWLKGKEYYIGEALIGEHVGLSNKENLELYYGPIYLGKLNIDNGLEKPKVKRRRQR